MSAGPSSPSTRCSSRPTSFIEATGSAWGTFASPWEKACTTAEVPDLLFHDLRRSAARNLLRAGVDPDVARKITGHKTESMFSRYNITDERDQREALRQIDEYVAARRDTKARASRCIFSEPLGLRRAERSRNPHTLSGPRCLTASQPREKQAPRAGLEPATNRLTEPGDSSEDPTTAEKCQENQDE